MVGSRKGCFVPKSRFRVSVLGLKGAKMQQTLGRRSLEKIILVKPEVVGMDSRLRGNDGGIFLP